MKKHILLSVFFSLALAQILSAQSFGANPALLMYRFNGGSVSPQPISQGDHIGTIRWDGLTAIGSIRTGASIQSFITGPVSAGMLPANMVFRTGAPNQLNRMVITEQGRVGIGIDNPTFFRLHVVGNTHTTENFYGRIHFDFDSPSDNAPNTYNDQAYFERKQRSVLGVPAVVGMNNFGGILSLSPGGGAHDHQLFFGQDGVWNRRETDNSAAWTGAWEKLLSSADIKGRKNLVARFLPPDNVSSKLGESQLYDDGSNVVIGGIPAAPAPATPVFDLTNLLTVNGATRVNGKTFINGRLGVGNNTPAEELDVTGDATVSGNSFVGGNLGVGTTTPAHKMHLVGDGYVNGRVAIGPTDHYASGFALSVNGKIITDELRVMLEPSWPDYVFEENYDLKPLAEVGRYIQENKRLPGVASAKEVAEQGLDLGEMQKVQMEKIEELFLYIIALEKEMKELKVENTALKAKVEQQGTRN